MSTPDQSYLVGLIGSGITRSLTPPLHELEADRAGIRYLYRPLDIDALGTLGTPSRDIDGGELLHRAISVGYNAFNITYPFKESIISSLDDISEQASRLNAVNTVVLHKGRLEGHNTDVTGFSAALSQLKARPSQSPSADFTQVTQIGTGGAGSATAYALLAQGTRTLNLFDLDSARAADKARYLAALFPAATVRALASPELPDAVAASTGLVNATPIGMHHHPGAPLPLHLIHADLWVADVIYLPQETPLIQKARSLGCRVLTGGHMAVGQAADAFALITGLHPNRAAMHDNFQRLIHQQQG